MADAERKRIRCIIRPRQFGQMKDIFGHLHHFTTSHAIADYCHFDLIGCIGNRFKPLLRKRKQDDAARLRDLDTSRYVLGERTALRSLLRPDGTCPPAYKYRHISRTGANASAGRGLFWLRHTAQA